MPPGLFDLAEAVCRFEARAALFPPGARCPACGEANPLVLVIRRRPVLCGTCSARACGRSGYELHHLGGRPSPYPPVRITVNEHKLLTFVQDVSWRPCAAPGSPVAALLDLSFWAMATEGGSDER